MTCWDLESWNVFKTIDEPHNEINALDFSHDGKIFATAGKVIIARLGHSSTESVDYHMHPYTAVSTFWDWNKANLLVPKGWLNLPAKIVFWAINPLNPNIHIPILQTDRYTFP